MAKIPKPQDPRAQERQYYKFLRKYVEAYIEIMRGQLAAVIPDLKDVSAAEQPRLDENIENKISRVIGLVDTQLAKQFPDSVLMRWAMSMVGGVNRHTKKQVNKQFKSQVVDKDGDADFVYLMNDKKMSAFFQNVVDENVGLIKSIPKSKQVTFKNNLVYLITKDATTADIQAEIMKHFKITKSHAKFIAQDQVGKLQGKVEQFRQLQLGVSHYTWRTSEDERVRPDHARLDGKRISWDKPPIVDRKTGRREHPKGDYRCRCWAEPDLDEVIDS